MRNTGLDESQVGIKIAGRRINDLRYADDITLMAENQEELKSLLMKVKEESGKTELKLSIQKTKMVVCFTLDNIHVLMLFSQNIPPWPSPTESKSLFCTFVSLFLFCKSMADSCQCMTKTTTIL